MGTCDSNAETKTPPAPSRRGNSRRLPVARLGDRDGAFEVLDRAATEFQAFMAFAWLPGFDPLRSDPGFPALLERLGLPSASVPHDARIGEL